MEHYAYASVPCSQGITLDHPVPRPAPETVAAAMEAGAQKREAIAEWLFPEEE